MKAWAASVAYVLVFAVHSTHGAIVSYHFSTTVVEVNPLAAGYPMSLNGLQVDDPVTGTLSYDTNSAIGLNPYGSPYNLATYYALASPSVSITAGSVTFDVWNGPISAFVWNDDVIHGPGTNDGLSYTNITTFNQAIFKIENTSLANGTFGSEALPGTGSLGPFVLDIGQKNSVWFRTDGLTFASINNHPGDFDSDGDVDGADFVAWQTHFPSPSGAILSDGDADGDGDVDGADFVVWQTNFPYSPPSPAMVPEPGSLMTCFVFISLLIACHNRTRRRRR